jgi:hypothetical protein
MTGHEFCTSQRPKDRATDRQAHGYCVTVRRSHRIPGPPQHDGKSQEERSTTTRHQERRT